MLNELDILREISERLTNAGLQFMLTGSLAMNFYATPRMTRDLDVVIELLGKDIGVVLSLFDGDYYIAREAVEEAIRYESMFNIIHQESVMKVDFIVRKRSEYRVEEFKRRRLVTVDGFQTWIVSREDLILSKLDWMKMSGSEMQRRDILNLLSGEVDMDYIASWAERLGLVSLLQEIINDRHTP